MKEKTAISRGAPADGRVPVARRWAPAMMPLSEFPRTCLESRTRPDQAARPAGRDVDGFGPHFDLVIREGTSCDDFAAVF